MGDQTKTQATDELFNPSYPAKPLSQEQCSSAALPSDYITSQGAGVHLPSSRAQQLLSSQEAEEHPSGMWCYVKS